ncbi:MAG: C39 family peptidase [Bdellovibrio sp.]
MRKKISLKIQRQPDNTTCGPTCLHSVYHFWDDPIELHQVIKEVQQFEKGGGTLAVILANHALARGYSATIYTYNLNIFDPSWRELPSIEIAALLQKQLDQNTCDDKFIQASNAYIHYLKNGGEIKLFAEMKAELIQSLLMNDFPVLTGLSSTYLYLSQREIPETTEYDAIKGKPGGHFVVLCGFDAIKNQVIVADPYLPNPFANQHYYSVPMDRLIAAILLGVVTYDGNLLIIAPKDKK